MRKATAADPNPGIGAWKLNVARSKFAGPAPKKMTIVGRAIGGHIEATITITKADGPILSYKCTSPEEGGVLECHGAVPPQLANSTVVHTVVNPNEYYSTALKDGKQQWLEHGVVSKDGKTSRITITGKDPQGKPFEMLTVLDKE